MSKKSDSPADFIVPLYINGLQGRMLRMPAPANRKREILFIYGHHSTIERWWGVIQDLNQYGAVTVPDLPGFGGMDSFYKIGQKPSLDNMADYLASFVKMNYKRRRVTIAGLSYGFLVVTRMLQRYPDLVSKVDLLVSVVGFAHRDDFIFSKSRYRFYLGTSRFLSGPISSLVFKNIALHPLILRLAYARTHNAKHKFKQTSAAEHKKLMDFEVHLWHANDARTHMATSVDMLTIDNCHRQVKLPVYHVSVVGEKYFDNNMVEQHLSVIFSHFHSFVSKMDNHAPSVIADKKMAAPLFPHKLRKILAQS